MIHVTCTTYLSVFKVLKSTRRTPLGISKDFITSAKKRILVKFQSNITNGVKFAFFITDIKNKMPQKTV